MMFKMDRIKAAHSNPPKLKTPIWLLFLLSSLSLFADPTERTWTNSEGQRLSARMVGLETSTVELRLGKSGRIVSVPIKKLSNLDRDYVKEWADLGYGTKVERWPEELAPLQNFTARKVRSETKSASVYATPNFHYHCDIELSNTLVKEYSETFEATYFAIANLPLNLRPKPPEGHFVVRLFKTRNDYLTSGGPEGSAGVYMIKSKEILVPMSSLGVRIVGKKVAMDRREYDSGTLVHEITHQVMHDWLDVLPVWFVEGIAEYMAAVPYEKARFKFSNIDKGIIEHLEHEYRIEKTSKGNYPVDLVIPTDLMSLTHQEWSSAVATGENAGLNYRSAMMLIYYFIHLDGKGDGSQMVAYLQQARRGADELEEFVKQYNTAVSTYNSQLEAYNGHVESFNKDLSNYRAEVDAYNQRVRTYNEQLAADVADSKLIKVEPTPGKAPVPPERPTVPQILAKNPDGGGPVDLMDAERKARHALFKKRTSDELWRDMESAFEKRRIQIRPIQTSRVKKGGQLRARPIF